MHFQTENFTFELRFIKPFMDVRHKKDIWSFLMLGWTPWTQNNKSSFVYVNKLS